MQQLLVDWHPLLRFAVSLVGLIILGWIIQFIFWKIVISFAGRTSTVLDNALVKHCRRPTGLIIPLILLHLASPAMKPWLYEPYEWIQPVYSRILMILLVMAVAWLLIRLGSVLEEVLLQQYRIDVTDNLKARRIQTQVQIIKRIITFLVSILSIGAILMGFEEVRQLGTGILASAGLAGLILGFAAQRTLSNLLAGIQIAFTQPITIDDVVIVEGEWGWIEEITLTYVVVRIWDLRRLILPISYFLEKPFQNWTRTTADILGTVYLYTDYTVPVDAIRDELKRIVKDDPNWDGKVASVVVTDSKERCLEVRALVSASSSGKAWDLRCTVREKLVTFLQQNYPQALPRVRLVQEARTGSGDMIS